MTRKPQHFKRGSLPRSDPLLLRAAAIRAREEGSNKYLADCYLNRRAERAKCRRRRRRRRQRRREFNRRLRIKIIALSKR